MKKYSKKDIATMYATIRRASREGTSYHVEFALNKNRLGFTEISSWNAEKGTFYNEPCKGFTRGDDEQMNLVLQAYEDILEENGAREEYAYYKKMAKTSSY